MIAAHDLPRHLIRRGLLEPSTVVAGRVVVSDVSSRNQNARVVVDPGRSLFVKQARDAADQHRLSAEATCYRTMSAQHVTHVPQLVDWDEERSVLCLSLQPGQDMHTAQHLLASSVPVAAAVADALATIHGVDRDVGPAQALTPGVLELVRPGLELLRDNGGAALELVRTIQRDRPLCEGLIGLQSALAADGTVHFDLKWDNIVVDTDTSPPGVAIVDWEMAGHGSRAWDVGCVIAGYLSAWLGALSARQGSANVPPPTSIASVQPAIRVFWTAYSAQTAALVPVGPDGSRPIELVTRCVAARLVQTAFEASHYTSTLYPWLVDHLQVASNMFADPGAAAQDLLGLPGHDTRPSP